jgi:peptide/nickel transport system substrate-binding protein
MLSGVAFLFWLGAGYLALTVPVPKHGGRYVEGVVSQPRYINPILSQTSDADADLVELLFAGLFSHDREGRLVKRVASDYSVSEDGRTYTIFLRTGVTFHDGEELTADDVVFTVQAIQDPATKSPLRANWVGIETNATDRYTVTFALKKPYFGFLENLTVGILPRHVWEDIAPEKFTLADYNLDQPIGAGPYRFEGLRKDAQGNILAYDLRAYEGYFDGRANVSDITLRFYPDEDSLIAAFDRQEILGLHSVGHDRANALADSGKNVRLYELSQPRAFVVFFNINKSVALAYDEVREALMLAADKRVLIDDVLKGHGTEAAGPFLPFMFGATSEFALGFDPERANALLDERGWTRGDDGIRAKNGVRLAFSLTVPDWPGLMRAADLLREHWSRIGASVEVKTLTQADLQQNVIRPREYEALLFGQGSLIDPDPYSYWHSSQKNDPGLNLAFFEDKRADEILATARETIDSGKRAELYREFQEIIAREHAALFLYSPQYLYAVSGLVQGIDLAAINAPADRLSSVTEWYIKTKRVKK